MRKADFVITKQNNVETIKYDLKPSDVYDDNAGDKASQLNSIIPFDYSDEDGRRTITAYAHEDTNLESMLKKVFNKKDVLCILSGLTAMFEVGTQGIPVSYIVKDLSLIYVNVQTYAVKCVAIPVKQDVMPLSEIPAFFRDVISKMRFSEEDKDNYVAKLITEINSDDFSVNKFKATIDAQLESMGLFISKDNGLVNMSEGGGEPASKGVKVNKLGVMNNMRRPMMGGQPPMGQPMMGGQPPMGQPMMGGQAPQPPMGQPSMGRPMMGGQAPQAPMGRPMMGGQAPMGQPMMGGQAPQAPMGQPMMGGQAPQPPMGQPMMGGQAPQPPMGQPMMGGQAPQAPMGRPMMGGQAPQAPMGQPMMGGQAPQAPMGQPMMGGQAPMGQPMMGGQAPMGQPMMGGQAPQAPMGQPINEEQQAKKQEEKPVIEEKNSVKSEIPAPVAPEMPKPVAPEMPKPVAPEMPKPVAPEMPKPVAPEMPKPVAPEMPKPVAPEMPKPVAPEMPKPVAPEMPKPVAPEMPKPVAPEMPKPVAPEMPKPVAPEMPKPVAPEMPKPVVPGPIMANSVKPRDEEFDPDVTVLVNEGPGALLTGIASQIGTKPIPHLVRKKTGEIINITKTEFSIGKSKTKADYSIENNTAISRVHCIIIQRDGVNYIKDNGSTNHTYINGIELQPGKEVLLKNKTVIQMGDEEFTFLLRKGE